MVPQIWIIHCLKMYKISHEVLNFIEKDHANLESVADSWRKSLPEKMIQRGIFQRGALLPLLFVIARMPLNHILRKCTTRYKFSRLQEKINHLM